MRRPRHIAPPFTSWLLASWLLLLALPAGAEPQPHPIAVPGVEGRGPARQAAPTPGGDGDADADGDPTGLATPDGEAWGDEWFDEASRARARDFEERMVEEAGGSPPPAGADAAPAASSLTAPPRSQRSPERAIDLPRHGFADVEAAWRTRREALLRQDAATARAAEGEMHALLLELDIREVHAFAAAVTRESRKLVESAPGEAVARAELATRMAPSLPLTHLQLFRAQLALDPTAVDDLAGALGRGMLAAVRDPRSMRLLAFDLAAALGAALLIGGAIALLFLALDRGRQFLHDFHHIFPRGVSAAQSAILVAMVLALPLALGYGPLVTAALVVAALWLYLDRSERIALGVWLALAMSVPAGAGLLAARLSWDDTQAASLYAVEQGGDLQALPRLAREAKEAEAEPRTLFVVARARKRLGDLSGAAVLYERALESRPRWPEAMINLGNIHFLRGDLQRAEELYTRAIDLDPGIAAAYFDLSRVHYDRVDFTLGQAARAKAIELEPRLVERYAVAENGAAPANQYVLDVPLADADLAAAATSAEPARLQAQLGSALLGRIPAPVAPFLGVAGLFFFVAMAAWGTTRFRPASGCTRCGRPVCWSCDPEGTGGNLCGQCITVFARRSLVDPLAQEQKERAVRAWQLRRGAWMGAGRVLLAGPFLAGKVVRGAAYLLVGWFLVLLIGMPAGLARPIYEGIPAGWKIGLLLPFLVAIYLLAWRDARGDR